MKTIHLTYLFREPFMRALSEHERYHLAGLLRSLKVDKPTGRRLAVALIASRRIGRPTARLRAELRWLPKREAP